MDELVECFRPTAQKELALVAASGYSKWPPRLPDQDIFYPVTNEAYATALTQWNITDFGVGYVTRFYVKKVFMDKYPIQCVGGREHTEWWIPASDLEELNKNIVGNIEVIAEYR
jgi:hypothetical protein